MRFSSSALLLLLLLVSAQAQRREGTYRPEGGVAVPWVIDDRHTLIWGGAPYVPAGTRIDGRAEAADAAKAAGVSDVIVDLPAGGMGWKHTFAKLNQHSMRFLIRISSIAPMAQGFAIEPQGYRVTGITKSRKVEVPLPGATSALVVLAARHDGSVQKVSRVPVQNGKLTHDVKLLSELEMILLIYPEMTSLQQPDYWEALDAHRDSLLSALKQNPPGAGLRGVVNPIGHTIALPGKELRFVPNSRQFRLELRELVEDRYKTLETAQRSWAMSGSSLSTVDDVTGKPLGSFEDLARLVPLWSGVRGVGFLWDPLTDRLYNCDSRRSTVWQDISDAVASAATRRYQRLVSAIRAVADVPVIQEWSGWAAPYELRNPPVDGIGMRAAGTTPSALADSGSRATSSILRWATRGWLIATDIDLGSSPEAASQLPLVLEDLTSLGASGFFVRSTTPAVVKAVAAEGATRSGPTSSPVALFYPENASNPAFAQRLPGGRWWLPTPEDGNRIDLGSQYFAYRLKGDSGNLLALWTTTPGRTKLRMAFPKTAEFMAIDGSSPDPKLVRGGVEVNLGSYPLIITGTDEVPIPEPAYQETVDRFAQLVAAADAMRRDSTEERLFFQDNLNGFERNPGGSFHEMRRQFHRLGFKIGTFTWVEAESSKDTNFSEPLVSPGISGNGALALRTEIAPEGAGYFANYDLPVKSQQDQEVWIAAKIPAERRRDVAIVLGGQVMSIASDPISPYADGYAWYRMGTTRMAGGRTRAKLQVGGSGGADVSVDVILFTPRAFTPRGISFPDPIEWAVRPIKK